MEWRRRRRWWWWWWWWWFWWFVRINSEITKEKYKNCFLKRSSEVECFLWTSCCRRDVVRGARNVEVGILSNFRTWIVAKDTINISYSGNIYRMFSLSLSTVLYSFLFFCSDDLLRADLLISAPKGKVVQPQNHLHSPASRGRSLVVDVRGKTVQPSSVTCSKLLKQKSAFWFHHHHHQCPSVVSWFMITDEWMMMMMLLILLLLLLLLRIFILILYKLLFNLLFLSP